MTTIMVISNLLFTWKTTLFTWSIWSSIVVASEPDHPHHPIRLGNYCWFASLLLDKLAALMYWHCHIRLIPSFGLGSIRQIVVGRVLISQALRPSTLVCSSINCALILLNPVADLPHSTECCERRRSITLDCMLVTSQICHTHICTLDWERRMVACSNQYFNQSATISYSRWSNINTYAVVFPTVQIFLCTV